MGWGLLDGTHDFFQILTFARFQYVYGICIKYTFQNFDHFSGNTGSQFSTKFYTFHQCV